MASPYEQQAEEDVFLHALKQHLDSTGLVTALFDPSPPAENFSSLVVAQPLGAARLPSVNWEFTFIPQPAGVESAYINLQTYAQLYDSLGPGAFDGLRWLTTKLNCFLPVGLFGLFENLGVLYWKHTHLLDKALPAEINLGVIAAQTAMATNVLSDFGDTLLEAATGARSAAVALRANKWAPLLFPDSGSASR
jgi:hypothetical protein